MIRHDVSFGLLDVCYVWSWQLIDPIQYTLMGGVGVLDQTTVHAMV